MQIGPRVGFKIVRVDDPQASACDHEVYLNLWEMSEASSAIEQACIFHSANYTFKISQKAS
jgi:hypothetical protein